MDARLLSERIETERLVLRRVRESDAPAVLERWATDDEVTRYLTWRPHESLDDTLGFLRATVAAAARGELAPFAIVERSDAGDSPIGMIGVKSTAAYAASVGYVLGRPWWGRGYMTEATRAVVASLLVLPAIHRVWSVTDVDNLASSRVLEKAGLELEGVLRRWIVHPNTGTVPRDVRCYSRVR